MARIVTTQCRYKRPPKKGRPVAIEVPEVVAATKPREIQVARRRAKEAEWSKENPRFQQGKPQAIVTSVGRKEARTDDEAATARWRAYLHKMRKAGVRVHG